MTKVHEVMTPDVVFVKPSTDLLTVARLLRDQGIGSVPVCNGIKLQGMVTDRDIITKVIAEGRDPASTKAEEIVEGTPIWISADADISEAERLMSEHQIRRLPVIDAAKRMVGIVALADIARADDAADSGRTLKEISQPN